MKSAHVTVSQPQLKIHHLAQAVTLPLCQQQPQTRVVAAKNELTYSECEIAVNSYAKGIMIGLLVGLAAGLLYAHLYLNIPIDLN